MRMILIQYVYIFIKNGRPVIIKQTRVGLHGDEFNMYKLRTMKLDSHSKRDELSELNMKVSKVRIGIVLSVYGGFLEKQILFNNLRFRPLINKGKQNISWIHIDDVVRIFYFLVENSLEGVYNATSPNFSTNLELTDKIENLRKKYLINISTPSLFASIPFKILRIGDFFKEVVMFNSKVIPKKLVDKGFVFKFESLKKIMTF